MELTRETVKSQYEALGANITPEHILKAQEKSWHAMELIRPQIIPGMTEKEAITLANKTLASLGVKKFWHRVHVRFGPNTLKSFEDPYENDGYQLKENDIFYIDMGPVWDGIEGDVGATFVLGSDPLMHVCAQDSKIIFNIVAEHWKQNKVTGKNLYQFAKEVAEKRGWILAPSYVQGHRLSEFPHAMYYKGAMGKLDFELKTHCWILEIQICHPELPIGAFYEDLLKI